MEVSDNIFLVGPMGSGKTVVGWQIAQLCSKLHLDVDSLITSRTGNTISDLFSLQGEGYFRRLEEKYILELTKKNNIVLSTGGGSVCSSRACDALTTRGMVIYLQVSIVEQKKRLAHCSDRPLFSPTIDLNYRNDMYLELADFTVSTNNKSILEVANDIVSYASEAACI